MKTKFSSISERYRLQCDTFEGLWYVVRELSVRLNNHFNRGKTGGFSIYFSGQVPLQDYFELIENHYEVRRKSSWGNKVDFWGNKIGFGRNKIDFGRKIKLNWGEIKLIWWEINLILG